MSLGKVFSSGIGFGILMRTSYGFRVLQLAVTYLIQLI